MRHETAPRSRTSANYRSKRARYTTRACKECQRRKVKCDGAYPCARCSGQLISCYYSTPEQGNSKRDRSSKSGPRRVAFENTYQPAKVYVQALPTPNQPDHHYTSSPDFCGPTSTEFTFNAVNGNLRAMGLESSIVGKSTALDAPQTLASRLSRYGSVLKSLNLDPLWDVPKQDALDLINDWFSGLGAIYPVVTREKLDQVATYTSDTLSKAQLEGLCERAEIVAEALFNQDTNKLKIVLAIGLTRRAGGRFQLAERLFQSVSEAVEGLMWNPQGIHGIQLLFLMAIYHYHLFDEVRCGRAIAFAARLCLEKGLHRRTMVIRIPTTNGEQSEALNAFWSVYMMERRLSLGQGIPFSIQDSYVDPNLFDMSRSEPVLTALLHWTRLAGKTWHTFNSQGEKGFVSKIDDLHYLDYQVLQWYDGLTSNLQLKSTEVSNTTTYIQSVLFVRKSHLRNLIYRPVLHSPPCLKRNEQAFLKGIDIVKETVRILFSLNECTTLVHINPLFFQPLLLTTLGNLLLIVVNASSTVWSSVRDEFDLLLDLFRYLASRCTALHRTWQRLQGLRDLSKKLTQSVARDDDRHAPMVHEHQIPTEATSQDSLTFDAIFPEFVDVGMDTNELLHFQAGSSTSGQESSDQFRRIFDNVLMQDNLFDFPFLDLENSVYVT